MTLTEGVPPSARASVISIETAQDRFNDLIHGPASVRRLDDFEDKVSDAPRSAECEDTY